ncbi:MAG: hypothetical protein ABIR11_10265 [Candidatus Limnocylindrales bacterium]
MSSPRRAFTLRFASDETHQHLALLAGRLGVSMNELAGQMIENEIGAASLALQEDFAHTLGLLASYGVEARTDLVRFAEAEVTQPDPLRARRAEVAPDPLGIAATFAAARER